LLEFLRSRLPDPAAQPADAQGAPLTAAGLARSRSGASGGGAALVGGAVGGGVGGGGGAELLLYGKGLSQLPPGTFPLFLPTVM
jgi:hypothetical protein